MIKEKLNALINREGLLSECAEILLNHGEDDETLKCYIKDILYYGCVSGIVSELIYYSDTHQFYDRNYYDIEELREEYEQMLGEPLHPNGDLKNWYAWFSFEEIIRRIAEQELNLRY